jgi:hypothetical protein
MTSLAMKEECTGTKYHMIPAQHDGDLNLSKEEHHTILQSIFDRVSQRQRFSSQMCRSVSGYRLTPDKFLAWAETNGVLESLAICRMDLPKSIYVDVLCSAQPKGVKTIPKCANVTTRLLGFIQNVARRAGIPKITLVSVPSARKFYDKVGMCNAGGDPMFHALYEHDDSLKGTRIDQGRRRPNTQLSASNRRGVNALRQRLRSKDIKSHP